MSKLKDTLLMMATEKETFEVNGKTFQIIEVKEAEQPQPAYSHLVGKWVKFLGINSVFTKDKWYKCFGNPLQPKAFKDDNGKPNGFYGFPIDEDNAAQFDLTNPQDSNPDEVKKILVPKEIKISIWTDGVLGVGFGENQVLFCSPLSKSYWVGHEHKNSCTPIQCELIKCERAELVKGDVAFRCSFEDFRFDILEQYCVIINDKKHCAIKNNDSVYSSYFEHEHWYKLQPIEQ